MLIKSDLIVYDVELCREIKRKQDWKTIDDKWFGSAVAYSYYQDRYYFFLHRNGLLSLRALLNKSRVITFNGINFDSQIVLGRTRSVRKNGEKYGLTIQHKNCQWIEYDIFVQCLRSVYNLSEDVDAKKRVSPGGFKLDDIAKKTIRKKKVGNGAEAPKLYQQKRYDELFSYNLQDVRITKMLFDHIKKFGWIKNRDGKKFKIERTRTWFSNGLIESEQELESTEDGS